MINFISKLLDIYAVNRIKKNVSARELLLDSYDGFDIQHEQISKDSLVDAIGNALPDMMWAKDLEGKYIWANQKIIDGLLFSTDLENTIGRTDDEMATARREAIGAENHTFGEVCGNSDGLILEKEKSRRFLEFGLVNGIPLYLEVHKNILRNKEGEIIGTVGTGRDLTEEYLTMQKISNKLSESDIDLQEIKKDLQKLMNKYYFEG